METLFVPVIQQSRWAAVSCKTANAQSAHSKRFCVKALNVIELNLQVDAILQS
jgi:hypothetical protein